MKEDKLENLARNYANDRYYEDAYHVWIAYNAYVDGYEKAMEDASAEISNLKNMMNNGINVLTRKPVEMSVEDELHILENFD